MVTRVDPPPEPSETLTDPRELLLGYLLKHLAGVERRWFRWGFAGERVGDPSEPHPALVWILFHVLQEYARHAGHLDVVRELADGTVGE
jgi:hypothetical protein